MKTYERICIKDYVLDGGINGIMPIRRGEKWLTTAVDIHGNVKAFGNLWGDVPASIFAGEIVFTE